LPSLDLAPPPRNEPECSRNSYLRPRIADVNCFTQSFQDERTRLGGSWGSAPVLAFGVGARGSRPDGLFDPCWAVG